ncbi:MAG: PIN domain-containing protein [Longispora sp.]|nr:PIN domain-containing protein [Longispora sp. (in: high G+C Gram-positive bacteria)]
MSIVVDAGPLIAVLNADDNDHDSCLSLLNSVSGPLLVPAPVIVEVAWMTEKFRGSEAEAAFLRSLNSGEVEMVALNSEDIERMAELVTIYADLPLGSVDASVIAVAERLGVRQVATLDRRHFTVVRPRHVEAFTLLPQ